MTPEMLDEGFRGFENFADRVRVQASFFDVLDPFEEPGIQLPQFPMFVAKLLGICAGVVIHQGEEEFFFFLVMMLDFDADKPEGLAYLHKRLKRKTVGADVLSRVLEAGKILNRLCMLLQEDFDQIRLSGTRSVLASLLAIHVVSCR